MSPVPISARFSARANRETCKCRCVCDSERRSVMETRMRRFLCVGLMAAAGQAAAASGMEHITILRDETEYYITPWLTRLNNGDLLVTAREAHARGPEQRGH